MLELEAAGGPRVPPDLAWSNAWLPCAPRTPLPGWPTTACPDAGSALAVAPGRVIPHPDGGWVRMLDGRLEGSNVQVRGADDAWEDGETVVLTHRLAGGSDAVPNAFVVLAPDRRPRHVAFDLREPPAFNGVVRVVCSVRGVADGRALVFAAERCDASRGRLFVVDLGDGRVTPLSELEGFPDHDVSNRAWLSGSRVLVADAQSGQTWQVDLETGAVRDLDLQDPLARGRARPLGPALLAVGPDGGLAAGTDVLHQIDGDAGSHTLFAGARAMTFHRDHLWVLAATSHAVLGKIDAEGRVVATWVLGGQGDGECTTDADRLDPHPRELAFRVRGEDCVLDLVIDLEGSPTFRRWTASRPRRPRAFELEGRQPMGWGGTPAFVLAEGGVQAIEATPGEPPSFEFVPTLAFTESPFAQYTMLAPGDADTLAFVEAEGDGVRWGPEEPRDLFAERLVDAVVVDADGVPIPFVELELQSAGPDAGTSPGWRQVTTDGEGRVRLPTGALVMSGVEPMEHVGARVRFPGPPVDPRPLAPSPVLEPLYANASGHERVVLSGQFTQPWPGVYVAPQNVVAVRFADGTLLSQGEVWTPAPRSASGDALLVRPSEARGVARYTSGQVTASSGRLAVSDVETVVEAAPLSAWALPDAWRRAVLALDGLVLDLGVERTIHRWDVGDVRVRYVRDVPCGAQRCAELSVSAPGWPPDGVVWIEPDTQRIRRLPRSGEPLVITWD